MTWKLATPPPGEPDRLQIKAFGAAWRLSLNLVSKDAADRPGAVRPRVRDALADALRAPLLNSTDLRVHPSIEKLQTLNEQIAGATKRRDTFDVRTAEIKPQQARLRLEMPPNFARAVLDLDKELTSIQADRNAVVEELGLLERMRAEAQQWLYKDVEAAAGRLGMGIRLNFKSRALAARDRLAALIDDVFNAAITDVQVWEEAAAPLAFEDALSATRYGVIHAVVGALVKGKPPDRAPEGEPEGAPEDTLPGALQLVG